MFFFQLLIEGGLIFGLPRFKKIEKVTKEFSRCLKKCANEKSTALQSLVKLTKQGDSLCLYDIK